MNKLGTMKEKMAANLRIMEIKMGAMGCGWSRKGSWPTKTFKTRNEHLYMKETINEVDEKAMQNRKLNKMACM